MSKKTNETERNRREFLQTALWAVAALPIAGVVISACTKSPNPADSGGVKEASNGASGNGAAPAGDQPVKEEDPVASSLGYKMDATKVDTDRFPKRKGADGEKEFCKNCQYFTKKNDNYGSCQIIRGGLVNANGWCNTWAQKNA